VAIYYQAANSPSKEVIIGDYADVGGRQKWRQKDQEGPRWKTARLGPPQRSRIAAAAARQEAAPDSFSASCFSSSRILSYDPLRLAPLRGASRRKRIRCCFPARAAAAAIRLRCGGPNERSSTAALLDLSVSTFAATHVRIIADNKLLFDGELAAWKNRHFSAHQQFEVTAGDSTAVLLELNGKAMPPLGAPGGVRYNGALVRRT